jgi:hypothetical protein
MNPFELPSNFESSIDSFLSDLEAGDSSVDSVSFPVDQLATVDAAPSIPSNNTIEVNTMIANNSSSNTAAVSTNTINTSMNTNNSLFRYSVDLTNQAASTKGGKVTDAAFSSEGAVIKVGAFGTWMENLLPYEVEFNTNEAVRRGLLPADEANGWETRCFDDVVQAIFEDREGVTVHLARHIKGESGKRDQLAPYLTELVSNDPNVNILNAQVKINLYEAGHASQNVYRDGKAVEVDDTTFDFAERTFAGICIYFDDLDFYGLSRDYKVQEIKCQKFTLVNYHVELTGRNVKAGLGAGAAAARLGKTASKKPLLSIAGAVNKGSDYLSGLEQKRLIRAAGIGSTAFPSAPKAGSDLADGLDAPKVKSAFVKPATNLGGLDV